MSESSETLQADLEANMSRLDHDLGALASSSDICKHLKQTLWPFLQSLVANQVEIDEVVEDLVDNADDILQPETAQVIAAALVAGDVVAAELAKRVQPGWIETPETRKQIAAALVAYGKQNNEAKELVAAITVIIEEEDDEDDSDPDENDDADDKKGKK